MLAAMTRTLPLEGSDPIEEVTCDAYGYTMNAEQVWWNPQTQEKYLLRKSLACPNGVFRPYSGPVIFGTGYTF